jgi:hypothetical protein
MARRHVGLTRLVRRFAGDGNEAAVRTHGQRAGRLAEFELRDARAGVGRPDLERPVRIVRRGCDVIFSRTVGEHPAATGQDRPRLRKQKQPVEQRQVSLA